MVPAESLSSGARETLPELRPSGELRGGTGVSVKGASADRRMRSRIGDLDRATCRTSLSQRQFLIQFQSDSASDVQSEPERFRANTTNNQWSGKVNDWD